MAAVLLFCCRRLDRRLRLVAVATEECAEEKTEKDFKTVCPPSRSDKVSGSPRENDPLCAESNDYGPEPRAPLIADTTEGQSKKLEVPTNEYCPMNGSEMSDYLQPRCDQLGYVPMGPPPDYDACVLPEPPPVSYANTENREPVVGTTCEKDCGMLGYDVLPPMNVYSEISEDADSDVDDEGDHVYESLDQAQPQ